MTKTLKANARLSVAPMMDWTDRHCRYLHRLMSRETLLYTEMITAPALVRGGAHHLLEFNDEEHPVALQLGGSDPAELAEAAKMAQDRGYDEINLNVGCPSDRVKSGCFGAVLMETPDLVARCTEAMIGATDLPVTVKCRIGVDDQDPRTVLPDFLHRVEQTGVDRVIVHARKAWLKGLSPKENREVPPLDYALVQDMKSAFSGMHVSINGGVSDLNSAAAFLAQGLDGIMIGRAAYHRPAEILLEADSRIFGAEHPSKTVHGVVQDMLPYIENECAKGQKLHSITRHMLGLFTGRPGARIWRRVLSEGASKPQAGPDLVLQALAHVPEEGDIRASA